MERRQDKLQHLRAECHSDHNGLQEVHHEGPEWWPGHGAGRREWHAVFGIIILCSTQGGPARDQRSEYTDGPSEVTQDPRM